MDAGDAGDAGRGGQSTPPDDAVLVDAMRKGDERAFDLLYERYFKRVYGFVDRRLDIRADVEETTQEVFASVFSSIDSYRGDAPFAAWVFGVTRRVIAARFKRKRHPTVPLGEQEVDLPSAAASALEAYECKERARQMRDAIDQRLSDEQRLLFRLHHLEDRSIDEIATALEKSPDAVKSNLYRTRKLLLAR